MKSIFFKTKKHHTGILWCFFECTLGNVENVHIFNVPDVHTKATEIRDRLSLNNYINL